MPPISSRSNKSASGIGLASANSVLTRCSLVTTHLLSQQRGSECFCFQDVRIPKEKVLGGIGQGFRLGLQILDYGRILMAAQCVGLGQAALEASIKYANERIHLGKPIGRFQAVQWKIADMACAIEASRLFTYKAAYMHDNGIPFGMASAMAKLTASEAAMQAAHGAVQIHGGYGLMKAYPVERYFRDAKMGEIYEGTSEIQRLVIANTLLRKGV